VYGRRWQQNSGKGSGFREWLEETPVVSLLAFASISLFLAVHMQGERPDYERWGGGSPELYWRGQVWRLLVNHVHHLDLIHLLFNLLWLVRLGRPLEQVAGTALMALFVLAGSLFIGLACALTIEPYAVGLSGLVYAIFGVVWVLRRQVPAFREALDEGSVKILIVWLFLCIALTYANVWRIANVGHFSGLAFGLAVGGGCRIWRRLNLAARIALFLPTLLLPAGLYYLSHPVLDPDWHFWRAYHSNRPEFQIREYEKALALRPKFPEARHNLAIAYLDLKRPDLARPALERLLREDASDPDIIEIYLEILKELRDYQAMPPWIERLRSLKPDAFRR
jgi:membrane associated rhomboid family serine protease